MTIPMVLLLPALFALMFVGVQGAMYYYARSVAIAAAQEGARDAGAEHGTREAGAATAREFVRDAGGDDVLVGAKVSGSRSATTATVTVTGTSLSLIPGWEPRITQSASVPVERLTRPSREFMISEGSGDGN